MVWVSIMLLMNSLNAEVLLSLPSLSQFDDNRDVGGLLFLRHI